MDNLKKTFTDASTYVTRAVQVIFKIKKIIFSVSDNNKIQNFFSMSRALRLWDMHWQEIWLLSILVFPLHRYAPHLEFFFSTSNFFHDIKPNFSLKTVLLLKRETLEIYEKNDDFYIWKADDNICFCQDVHIQEEASVVFNRAKQVIRQIQNVNSIFIYSLHFLHSIAYYR